MNPKHQCDPVGLLLAAGSSSRFGAEKLLHRLPDGTPIGLAAARNLRDGAGNVLVVLRPDSYELQQILKAEKFSVVLCDNAEDGMAASLVCGVRSVDGAGGYIIGLGDMPFVRQQTISNLASALQRGALIAAPYYHGQRGNPVGFSAFFTEQLKGLQGDQGARSLLRANENLIQAIHGDDPGILVDIDTPEDIPTQR